MGVCYVNHIYEAHEIRHLNQNIDILKNFRRFVFQIKQIQTIYRKHFKAKKKLSKNYIYLKRIEEITKIMEIHTTNPNVKEVEAKHGKLPILNLYIQKIHREFRDIVVLEDGSKYMGEWNIDKNEKEGFGIQILKDGSKYVGSWAQDKASGIGRMIYSNGDIYEGEWLNDKANNFEKYTQTDGSIYIGNWTNDEQNGEGMEIFNDQAEYKGQYINGKKNGKGIFKWLDGTYFDGEFKDNVIEGFGFLI